MVAVDRLVGRPGNVKLSVESVEVESVDVAVAVEAECVVCGRVEYVIVEVVTVWSIVTVMTET